MASNVMRKVSLRSLAAHKVRLILTVFSVVLGTSFVAAAVIFTSTVQGSFNAIFDNVARGVAAEAMLEVGVSACTDVTGFGLLGHLREMAAASGVDVEVEAAAVPLLSEARDLAAADCVPGGSLENLEHVAPHVDFAPGLSRVDRLLLADAQTSGGLLISLPEERCEGLLSALRDRGVADARRIGRISGPGKGGIVVS